MSRRKARFSIGVVWMCSFIIAAPLLKFRDLNVRRWMDYTESWCDDSWPVQRKHVYGSNMTIDYMPSRTIYFTFVSAVLYFLPMVAMSISYTIIIIKLGRKTTPGEQLNAGLVAQQKRKRKVDIQSELCN
ncbi:hypothetical protein DPMN_150993 [Dreissena polymorpha]|uniref:G-protein coupled receptors family 1 profile domain-containing protein n=1 Tax=Dreissena polymorpha TaxID=45954 RepID=A0A9D4FFL3_DREPO|nr:hypothetical protein DPMN_150993 [Dreissena polymorpha]